MYTNPFYVVSTPIIHYHEQELSLHAVEPSTAESAVLRQRTIDWQYRSQPAAHAKEMHKILMPFVAVEKLS